MIRQDLINKTIVQLLPEAQNFLCELIRIPSLPGQEQDAMEHAYSCFAAVGTDVRRVMLSDAIKNDPDYSSPIPDIRYDGRYDIAAVRKSSGGGKSVILNTHIDIVPPSEGMKDPYAARLENGIVFGRGACDAKGQVATIWLVLKTLDELGSRLKGDVAAHVVVEEENGGNGTLAMVRTNPKAEACIVLEPSGGKLFTSIRGAVWFKVECEGTAGHSGQVGATKSALLIARDVMAILENYHVSLLAASRGIKFFDDYPNPMPITFGRLEAGNWPAAAPSRARLEGVLGILPNKTKEQVCHEMKQALLNGLGPATAEKCQLTFTYRHDSSVLDCTHELPQGISNNAHRLGHDIAIDAMTASCDAWLYNNLCRIPTVVYGPGTLKYAHSKDEQISMVEIKNVAQTLVSFLISYCGVA